MTEPRGNHLRVKGSSIISLDQKDTYYRDSSIIVNDGTIVDILSNDEAERKYPDMPVLDAQEHVIIPGLINVHMHSDLVRGISDNKPLYEWHDDVSEGIGRAVLPEDARLGSLVNYGEAIKSGTTSVLVLEKYATECYKSALEIGIRATIVPYILDVEDCTDTVEENLEYVKKTFKPGERVRFWFGFDSFREANEKLIKEIADLAREYGTGIYTHSNEAVEDVQLCRKLYGKDPIVQLHELGVLGEHAVLVHCVHLTDEEKDLLVQTKTKVAHCPTANAKLVDGIAPVVEYLSRGLTVGLGTDSPACNNNHDMLEAMKLTALLQRLDNKKASALVADQVLRMVTIEGAKIMGLSDDIGSIEKGKRADLCILDLNKLHCLPLDRENLAMLKSHIVYSANGADVNTVIIDGKVVMRDRVLQTVNEEEVIQKADQAGKKLIARM